MFGQEGTNGGALRREYATLSSLKHPNIALRPTSDAWERRDSFGV